MLDRTFLLESSIFNSVIMLSLRFAGKSSFGVPIVFFKPDNCLFKDSIFIECSFCCSNNLNSILEY